MDKNTEGAQLLRSGRVGEAIDVFRQAASEAAMHPEPQNNLAIALWQAGRRDEALQAMHSAIEIDPQHRAVVQNGIGMLAAVGEVNRARALCELYLARHADDEEIRQAHERLVAIATPLGHLPQTPSLSPTPIPELCDRPSVLNY
ncbi:MAG: tetratricopeptide repeat protein, partial [Bdellovibrionales bacterium]|nr:tetratricopeptide repeat protein [Bdellovibrionales bacterium]